jgi:hypothetical protein
MFEGGWGIAGARTIDNNHKGGQQMDDIVVDGISDVAVVDEAGAPALQVGSREVPIGALVILGFAMKLPILRDECPYSSLLRLIVT